MKRHVNRNHEAGVEWGGCHVISMYVTVNEAWLYSTLITKSTLVRSTVINYSRADTCCNHDQQYNVVLYFR